MSHGIMEHDAMFSGNGIRPWHGLGTVIDGTVTSDEAIKLANLGWDVVQQPVYLKGGIEIPNTFANVRSDTKQVLGVVKEKYQVYQNKDLFEFTDAIIKNAKGVECKYETAGSLYNGARVFLLVRLPETNLVGDKVENYLFVSNGHNGVFGLMAGITNVRVVCNNTLQLAEQGATRLWRVPHLGDLQAKQKEAENSLSLSLNYVDRIKEDAEKLAIEKVNEDKFFREFFKKFDFSETKKKYVLESIADIYKNKDDLQNFRGTKWGLYNAVADFVSNDKKKRPGSTTQMIGFMDGYDMLNKAQKILIAA